MIVIVKEIKEVKEYIYNWKKEGLKIGLVPTMGYLHEGHQSLIKRAVKENDRVIVSDFVNPMQFGKGEDLESYPRDLKADAILCEETGAHLIFNPEPEEMYNTGFCSFVDMIGPTSQLCGKTRPVHFRGVCTIVNKLFNICQPDNAYFGQKDAQQLSVIKRMVKDLNMNVNVVGCPIIREDDGLAKSSRNTYLSEDERKAALILSKTIFYGQDLVKKGERNSKELINKMTDMIKTEPSARIDYVEVVGLENIEKIEKLKGEVLVAMAVYIGTTRLIDNFIYTV